MKKINTVLIVVILLLIGGGFLVKNYYQGQLKKERLELRKEKLKNDELKQVAEGHYQKLVADTLQVKDLKRIVKGLEIKLDAKPHIVYQIKYIPKEVDKDIDLVIVENDTLSIESFYPNKEQYFVKYQNKISLLDQKGKENWLFNSLSVSAVISERGDGMFTADFITPDFLSIESVDIQSVPLTPIKPNNFGWLLGAGVGKDFKDDTTFGKLSAGFRHKRTYLIVGAGTNQTVDGGIKFEF